MYEAGGPKPPPTGGRGGCLGLWHTLASATISAAALATAALPAAAGAGTTAAAATDLPTTTDIGMAETSACVYSESEPANDNSRRGSPGAYREVAARMPLCDAGSADSFMTIPIASPAPFPPAPATVQPHTSSPLPRPGSAPIRKANLVCASHSTSHLTQPSSASTAARPVHVLRPARTASAPDFRISSDEVAPLALVSPIVLLEQSELSTAAASVQGSVPVPTGEPSLPTYARLQPRPSHPHLNLEMVPPASRIAHTWSPLRRPETPSNMTNAGNGTAATPVPNCRGPSRAAVGVIRPSVHRGPRTMVSVVQLKELLAQVVEHVVEPPVEYWASASSQPCVERLGSRSNVLGAQHCYRGPAPFVGMYRKKPPGAAQVSNAAVGAGHRGVRTTRSAPQLAIPEYGRLAAQVVEGARRRRLLKQAIRPHFARPRVVVHLHNPTMEPHFASHLVPTHRQAPLRAAAAVPPIEIEITPLRPPVRRPSTPSPSKYARNLVPREGEERHELAAAQAQLNRAYRFHFEPDRALRLGAKINYSMVPV